MISATVNSEIVEISFKGRRREHYQNPDGLEFRTGEYLIVQAERGEDMGIVVLPDEAGCPGGRKGPLRKILRRATAEEISRLPDLLEREEEAAEIARQKVGDHRLDMKLVDVECQFDGNRITFYFTAEQRVDFRELVKDLAAVFRTRIELRQIGVRDEAGRHGGVGVCGRPLCCTCWIRDFDPITLRMAKDQNLSLSPSKLSGVCGRLKCCLRYELAFYSQAQLTYPRPGARVTWNDKVCEVARVDIFTEQVQILDPEQQPHWIPLSEMPEIPREDRLSFKKRKSGAGFGTGGFGVARREGANGGAVPSGRSSAAGAPGAQGRPPGEGGNGRGGAGRQPGNSGQGRPGRGPRRRPGSQEPRS